MIFTKSATKMKNAAHLHLENLLGLLGRLQLESNLSHKRGIIKVFANLNKLCFCCLS